MKKQYSADENNILFFAFRYVFGRTSTASSIVIKFINDNIEKVDTFYLDKMAKEICERKKEIENDLMRNDWLMFHDNLVNEVKTRKTVNVNVKEK